MPTWKNDSPTSKNLIASPDNIVVFNPKCSDVLMISF